MRGSPMIGSRKEDGVFWPCPSEDHPGTPRLFLDRFATADGRARFHPVEFRAPAEEPDHEFPLYLTTGRIMAQYQSGTQTRRVAALMQSVAQGIRADSSVHGAHLWNRARRRGSPDDAPGHGVAGRGADPNDSHGHLVRAVSFQWNGSSEFAYQSGAGSGFPHARIQSLRCSS